MKPLIDKAWQSRSFFLGASLFKFEGSKLVQADQDSFEKSTYPLLVIGRENYIEEIRQYPLVETSELLKIIRNTVDGMVLHQIIDKSDSGYNVRIWTLNQNAVNLVQNKVCLWLPETYLLMSGIENREQLAKIDRAGKVALVAISNERWVSAMSDGMYQNHQYFILASGIGEGLKTKAYSEEQFCQLVYAGLRNVNWTNAKSILIAQDYPAKLSRIFSLPSIAIGAVCAFVLAWLLEFGYLNLKLKLLKNDNESYEVTDVLSLKRDVEGKAASIDALANLSGNKRSLSPLWLVLSKLMENRIMILRVSMGLDSVDIRMQAKTETEAIELVRSLPWVESAEFSTPIRDSRGNKRFNIAMTLRNEVERETDE